MRRAPGADVAAAFERIRQSETLNVRRSDRVRIEPRPAVSGCEIVLEDRLVSDDGSAAVRYAYDVDLIALIDLAPSHTQVPELFAAYQRRAGARRAAGLPRGAVDGGGARVADLGWPRIGSAADERGWDGRR